MITIFRRGQAFAIDLIIASVLFIFTFVAFYGFLTYVILEPEEKQLAREGQQIATALSTEESPVQIIDGHELNLTKLEKLTQKEYDELKGQLGLKNDFCIYIEDDQGNLVLMSEDMCGVAAENVIITEKLVMYRGKPLKINIVTWNKEKK